MICKIPGNIDYINLLNDNDVKIPGNIDYINLLNDNDVITEKIGKNIINLFIIHEDEA